MGLGATRPSYCAPVDTSTDPCEMRYSVDIPVVGRTDMGVPVDRIVADAMESAVRRLPSYLPVIYSQLQPYIAAIEDDVVRTVEYEADYLADQMLQTKIDPRVTALVDEVTADANALKDEILTTLMAIGAALIIATGVGAWWVNREAEIRRSGR